MRILFLTPYPQGTAPGQRFRYEQYLDLLIAKGHQYHLSSFLSLATWAILYKPGHTLTKALGVLAGFGRRALDLVRASRYDFVFVYREATPVGPPIVEWILVKVLRKRIIYDFDDAIWLPNTSETNGIVARIKWHHKVANICQWAHCVSCGNAYLAAYAQQFNQRVVVNPTTIDTERLHNKVRDQMLPGPLIIGWTGTHSTLQYLDQLVPVLAELEQEFAFEFVVISNEPPHFSLKSLVFKPWRKSSEMSDLLSFHVGIMPLNDDAWSNGKCAFKALQYMALGIPALVSPIGMNTEVVTDGQNGFLCDTPAEWTVALRKLLTQPQLRAELGANARRTIIERYSVQSNEENFLNLFRIKK